MLRYVYYRPVLDAETGTGLDLGQLEAISFDQYPCEEFIAHTVDVCNYTYVFGLKRLGIRVVERESSKIS